MDTAKNTRTSESINDIKINVYGDTAIARSARHMLVWCKVRIRVVRLSAHRLGKSKVAHGRASRHIARRRSSRAKG